MCSIGEDDFGDEGGCHAMPLDKADDETTVQIGVETTTCSKCQQEVIESYKLRFRSPECKNCFIKYVTHKFRATLGSSKILPKNARVLVFFDGSEESLAMLNMMYHAQTLDNFKRLHCSAIVLYIDDFHLLKNDSNTHSIFIEEHLTVLDRIQTIFCEYPQFESYIMPLVDEDKAIELIKYSQDYINQIRQSYQDSDDFWETMQSFKQQLTSIKSSTSRQDFLRYQRYKLITLAAKCHRCEFAFMPDIATTLASNLLANIALGRGASAALDVSIQDNRFLENSNVRYVRPFKDLNKDEIVLYIKACNLEKNRLILEQRLNKYLQDDLNDDNGSIQNLAQKFINQLQSNFSSTVSTVSRTGDKLKANSNPDKFCDENIALNYCSFCNSILDCETSTTLKAIKYSAIMSHDLDHKEKLIPDCTLKLDVLEDSVSNTDTKLIYLCYGCRNIYSECSDKTLLAKMVTNKR